MPGRLLLLALTILMCLYGQGAHLSIPDQSLRPGQVAVASLSLDSAGQAVAAIQFDFEWDQTLDLHITAGDQLRSVSKAPYIVSLAPQRLRCLIAGLNQTAIANGELLKVFIFAGPASSAGAAQVRITNPVAADPSGLAIPLNATPAGIQIQDGTVMQAFPANAVLNTASLSPGPLSPGEIITLFGFNVLPDVSVRINDSTASVLYAGNSQINAIVPFGLNLTSPASLEVTNQNQTVRTSLPVAPAAPAIFTAIATGIGPGVILNDDNSSNSFDNPARPGSIITVYGTGFGALQSTVIDGQVTVDENPTVMPVTASVAGLPADVLYAGAAPGFMAGVTQIRVRLPPELTRNLVAPLQLSISGSRTPAGVTVAIQ